MDFFKGIKTLKMLKMKFRELCKIHHPDLGGDTETMKMLNKQYEQALKWVHDDKGERLNAEGIQIEKDLMEVISKIVALKGLIIEVTGRWIWVTGETRQYKTYLKECGLWWASKKLAWYWRPQDAKAHFSRGNKTIDQIRAKYGSISVDSVNREALA
jgi:hypothetical protein